MDFFVGESHSASEIKSKNWNNGDMTQAQHTKLLICRTYTQDTDLHLFCGYKKPQESAQSWIYF